VGIMSDRHKELKLAYKQNPPAMGVFQIKNNINGKIFIGSSQNVAGKLNSQRFQLKGNGHVNKALQQDWNDYGSGSFAFDILETLKTEEFDPQDWPEALALLEEKWLDILQPYGERGYNKGEKGPSALAGLRASSVRNITFRENEKSDLSAVSRKAT
ncbi:GIY-YIG nuclease family protein, partial [Acetonema longum]|uniref:GIY-YIG nuclease family protein n=1 Tax=Acetonema longum TaxID=2374 RepID=UPI001EE64BFF